MTDPQPPQARPSESRRRLNRFIAYWSRWLHIYLSLFALATILFFSITGLTLNHPDWFFDESTTEHQGQLNSSWFNIDAPAPTDWDEVDFSHRVAKLEVAEYLRATHGLRGSISDFLAFEDECEVTFQSPGYAATARIQTASGDYTLTVTTNDLVSIFNDLHKGRHSGSAWSWVIDISAVLSAIVAVTGFILIFYLKLRRSTGLIAAALGTLVLAVMYAIAVS
ncbi:MAG: PepSY-associated TM helix domain-containing protein [Fuerstiella sp.]